MRPEVPAGPRRTAYVLGTLLAASLLILALVDEGELQLILTVPTLMAGAVVLLVWRRRRAKELGIESSTDLPTLARAPRLLVPVIAIGGLVALLATDSFYSAWLGVLMVVIFAVDDVVGRWSYREVLAGGDKARRRPPPLRALELPAALGAHLRAPRRHLRGCHAGCAGAAGHGRERRRGRMVLRAANDRLHRVRDHPRSAAQPALARGGGPWRGAGRLSPHLRDRGAARLSSGARPAGPFWPPRAGLSRRSLEHPPRRGLLVVVDLWRRARAHPNPDAHGPDRRGATPPVYGAIYALYTLAYAAGLVLPPLTAGLAVDGAGFEAATLGAGALVALVGVALATVAR